MGDNKRSFDTLGLRWSVQPHPKGNAQIRLRVNGVPIAISTGEKSPTALSRAKQLELIRVKLSTMTILPRGARGFDSEIERFIRLRLEGRSVRTVYEVRLHLERLKKVLGVEMVGDVTKRLCEARKGRLQAGFSPKTWKNFLTTARRFFRWEMGEGILKEDPLANFQTPAQKTFGRREDIWEPDRLKKTLAKLKSPEREWLILIRETGMDSADLYGLKPSHLVEAVDPEGKKFWKLFKPRAKAKSSLEIIDQPLSTKAREILIPRKKTLWDFSGYVDSQSFASSFLKKVKAAQIEAGFEPMVIKSLRHTFATYHANRYVEGKGGPPMEVLRKWMGHAPSSRVLEGVYIHSQSSPKFQV